MSETPVTQDKEAFEAFKKKYNLDPANNLAIMNCLFEQSERIERIEQIVNNPYPIYRLNELSLEDIQNSKHKFVPVSALSAIGIDVSK